MEQSRLLMNGTWGPDRHAQFISNLFEIHVLRRDRPGMSQIFANEPQMPVLPMALLTSLMKDP